METTMNILRTSTLTAVLSLGLACATVSAAPNTNSSLSGTGYSVGDTAYDFTAPDQNGVTTTLYSHYGQFTILTFTAAWCGPCLAEESVVAQAVSDLAEGFGFPVLLQLPLLIQNINESVSDASGAGSWASRFKLPSVYHCNGDPASAICTQFNSYSIPLGGPAFPTTVIISPRMKILWVSLGDTFSTADLELLVQNDLKNDMADAQATLHPRIASLIPLIANTPLDPQLAKLLTKDAQGALAAFDGSRTQEAISKLNVFINRLQQLVNGGSGMWSCPEAAPIVQPLIDRANSIISALSQLPSQ
jgi:thiol-disulfide isomerase/thioredoxin